MCERVPVVGDYNGYGRMCVYVNRRRVVTRVFAVRRVEDGDVLLV